MSEQVNIVGLKVCDGSHPIWTPCLDQNCYRKPAAGAVPLAPQEQRLAEIQQRCEKAMKGPWHMSTEHFNASADGVAASILEDADDWHVAQTWSDFEHEDGDGPDEGAPVGTGLANADFIAHAREDIPFLLGEIARVTRERNEARAERDQWQARSYRFEQIAANRVTP